MYVIQLFINYDSWEWTLSYALVVSSIWKLETANRRRAFNEQEIWNVGEMIEYVCVILKAA